MHTNHNVTTQIRPSKDLSVLDLHLSLFYHRERTRWYVRTCFILLAFGITQLTAQHILLMSAGVLSLMISRGDVDGQLKEHS